MNRIEKILIFLRSMRSFLTAIAFGRRLVAVNKTSIFFGLVLLPVFVFAQSAGGIRGMVYDMDFDAPLAGAEISIAETGQKVMASDEGNYVFSGLEPGVYTLVVSKEGYTRKVFADVVVPSGSMTDQDASLAGEFTEMEEFVAQDLNLRMETPALMDSVGSDMMSRAGASDAAGALKLVAGATVQDGKYAVVRGLPDRYVSSQMNGVRLPTADPDKRAVQLDQFPAELIESIQVSKTFTPDQQGDASGGAVNVVLKGIPDETILKFSVGTKYNTQTTGNDDFLTYKGGGVNFLGLDDGSRDEQTPGTSWDGAVGVSRGDAPVAYDWSVTAGGKKELFNGVRVGGLGNVYYKRDASYSKGGIDDKWWARPGDGGVMSPQYSGASGQINSKLFDVTKSSDEVQWGGLGVLGLETDNHSLKLLSMQTHVAEDKVVLAEDTRGKEYFVTSQVLGYDPLGVQSSGDNQDVAPYRRSQTLHYTERDTETLQLSGTHKIPFPKIGKDGFFQTQKPEFDWTVARSGSSLNSPDKRMFGSQWKPEVLEIIHGRQTRTNHVDQGYFQDLPPGSGATLGSLQRVWEEISEESEQYFMNGKLPFSNWSGEEGYVKVGVFNDKVVREYKKDSFSNSGEDYTGTSLLGWDEYWSDLFPSETHLLVDPLVDTGYEGKQDISAWYYMVDFPIFSFFKVVGGARYEKTDLSVEIIDPEAFVYWVDPANPDALSNLHPGDADVDYKQDDILPSLGFEFAPLESLTLRASYSETTARQTFKELTPIQQMEYLGGDVFIGNPTLTMSALKNYDLRADWIPYQGGLVSISWFKKEVKNPIEYVQGWNSNIGTYITPVNYSEGELNGFEIELRQQLGRLWNPLEGLSVGANATLIRSEVTLPQEEQDDRTAAGFPAKSRDMLNTPEYLYNLNFSYDIEKSGTQLGLFYTVQGDSLVAGGYRDIGYVPDVYATEYGTLNFSLSQKIGEHFKLSFKAKNLLDPEIQEVYRDKNFSRDTVKTSYKKGVDFSISLSGEF